MYVLLTLDNDNQRLSHADADSLSEAVTLLCNTVRNKDVLAENQQLVLVRGESEEATVPLVLASAQGGKVNYTNPKLLELLNPQPEEVEEEVRDDV